MPFSVFPLTENVEPFLACHILNFLNRFLFVFCNYFIKTDCKLTLKGNSMLLCASQVAQQVQGLIPVKHQSLEPGQRTPPGPEQWHRLLACGTQLPEGWEAGPLEKLWTQALCTPRPPGEAVDPGPMDTQAPWIPRPPDTLVSLEGNTKVRCTACSDPHSRSLLLPGRER